VWVYSPSSLQAARDVDASLVVYDCVAADLRAGETELLARADLVFTAGTSLFEAKRAYNVSTYPLPSSVDAEHFAPRKRVSSVELRRLERIEGPRVGFLGTIDGGVDLDLVDHAAALRPNVQLVLAGGLAGVTTWDLPDRPNVHWLGAKGYDELPAIVSSWDAAMFPFRADASTRRTEASGVLACMAAGKPIVATPLDELVPHAERGLLNVVDPNGFVAGIDAALAEASDPVMTAVRRIARDTVLGRTSWDRTFHAMVRLVDEALISREVAARRGLTRPSAA
jgi:UDP-galactopyranose mutase